MKTSLKTMSYRKLDGNGDYVLGQGKQNFITGIYAVTQAVETNLKLLQGEWWEDTSKGLPMFQNILGQTADKKNSIDLLVQNQILKTDGVIEIVSFSSTFSNRNYQITCEIKTQFGNTIVQTSIVKGG